MRTLLCLLLALVVISCAGAPRRKPLKAAPPNLQQEFSTARAAWQGRDSKRALVRLKKIIAQYPESEISDDAAVLIGDIYFDQQQLLDAYQAYNSVASGEFESPLETQASLKAARCLVRLQRTKDAAPYLEKVIRNPETVSLAELMDAHEILYESLAEDKRGFEALSPLVFLAGKHPSNTKRDYYKQLAFEYLEGRLTEEQVEQVADNRHFGFLQSPAKFRYALIMAERKQFSKARRYLDEIMALAPDTELSERAQTIAQQIDARQKVDPQTIGVVLPLSGKQATVGYKALRGIQHGLGIYGKNPTSFRLAVIDSEGNPDVARRAVERLVMEDNVAAIIGGLLSKTAAAEASKANEFGVPIITMSQKAGLTQIGEYVFRNAMTSQMQVQYLVETAMGQFGLSKFAVIYPNDAYGAEFANLFWDEVKARGGSIQGAQSYDPQETDFRGHVQRLVGNYYVEDRDDYANRLKAWQKKNPHRSARKGGPTPEEILPPIVDFEAIFIPDNTKAVGQIAPMLAYNDVNNVRLLGTNIWNSKSLVGRSERFVEDSIFVDSILANDRGYQNSEFYRSFRQIFNEDPGIFEVQGHDSALLLRQLIGGGETSRFGIAQRLAGTHGFSGAIGPLSVNSDREVRRPMVGLTVKEGQITPLNQVNR